MSDERFDYTRDLIARLIRERDGLAEDGKRLSAALTAYRDALANEEDIEDGPRILRAPTGR
jgi:hypothetical protein